MRYLIFLMLWSVLAYGDVTIPAGTKDVYSNQDLNRTSIYLLNNSYYADSSANTMQVAAPSLADDNTVFLFPADNGTVNYYLRSDGSGASSWIELDVSHDANAAATLGVSTTSDAEFQSVKTSGTAGAGFVQYDHQSSDAATPGSGLNHVRLFAKSKVLYTVVDDGAGSPIVAQVGSGAGAGAGGAINFITNDKFETDTSDWTHYDDGAATTPVDGTGEAGATDLAISRNTSTPLRDSADLKGAKTGSTSTQGEGFSTDLTIDLADVNKRLSVAFQWKTTADYASDDMGIYIYDKDNAALINPSSINLPGTNTTITPVQVFFNATDADDYRLIFHTQSTNATDYDVFVDNVTLGPQETAQVIPASDWAAWTPSQTAGLGTLSDVNLEYRRVGDTMYVRGEADTGNNTGTVAEIELPNSLTIACDSSGVTLAGTVIRNESGGETYLLATDGDSFFNIGTSSSANAFTAQAGNAIFTDDIKISIFGSVRIAEWAGSAVGLTNSRVSYAFNTDVTDANDTTSFGYGPAGQQANYTFTAVRDKRVRFLTPIQSTDKITFEVSGDRITWLEPPWNTPGGYDIYSYDGSVGFILEEVNSTDVDVKFTRYISGTNNWSVDTFYWRLSKSSNPLSVGSKVPNSQIRVHTINAHGSGNTRIRVWTTAVDNYGDAMTLTGLGDTTDGTSIVINRPCIFISNHVDVFNAALRTGLSLNSSQLSTNISSITTADRLGMADSHANNAPVHMGWAGKLDVGDVLRVHTEAGADGTGTARATWTVTCAFPLD